MILKTLIFADGVAHDSTVSEASVSQKIEGAYNWSIIPVKVGSDASPTYTIEVSNDNVNFVPFSASKTDVLIDDKVDDLEMNFFYLRVNYNKQTNITAGTVAFTIALKQNI